MRATVASNAGRGLSIASFHGLCVKAPVVCGLLFRVALGASDLCWSGFVRRSLHVRVAIDAGEHASVNRALERVRIYEKAQRFAIPFRAQGVIAVASQAFVIGWL